MHNGWCTCLAMCLSCSQWCLEVGIDMSLMLALASIVARMCKRLYLLLDADMPSAADYNPRARAISALPAVSKPLIGQPHANVSNEAKTVRPARDCKPSARFRDCGI